jgi:hypothetical protein
VKPEVREPCREKGCFSTFVATAAHPDETRYCNRGGPDGGHPHKWDGKAWKVVTAGAMEHDRA